MRSNRKQKVFVSRAFAMLLSILMVLATFMPSGVFAENPVEDETVVAEMFETEDADSVVETEEQVKYGTYFLYDSEKLKVSVECGEEAQIPETASLRVEKLEDGSDKYLSAYGKVAEKYTSDSDVDIIYCPYDIYFVDNDVRVEPVKGLFHVRMEFVDAPIVTPEDATLVSKFVAHVDHEGEVEFVENKEDSNTIFSFDVSSFSPMGPVEIYEVSAVESDEAVIAASDGEQDTVVATESSLDSDWVVIGESNNEPITSSNEEAKREIPVVEEPPVEKKGEDVTEPESEIKVADGNQQVAEETVPDEKKSGEEPSVETITNMSYLYTDETIQVRADVAQAELPRAAHLVFVKNENAENIDTIKSAIEKQLQLSDDKAVEFVPYRAYFELNDEEYVPTNTGSKLSVSFKQNLFDNDCGEDYVFAQLAGEDVIIYDNEAQGDGENDVSYVFSMENYGDIYVVRVVDAPKKEPTRGEGDTLVTVESFTATLNMDSSTNLVYEDGVYYLRTDRNYNPNSSSNPSGWTEVFYVVDLSLSGRTGETSAHAGDVTIRIPAHLFYHRDDTTGMPTHRVNGRTVPYDADTCILPIPKAPATNADIAFNYTYDEETDEYVISNYADLTGALQLRMTFQYEMPALGWVVDGTESVPFDPVLTLCQADGSESTMTAEADRVVIDTQAKIDNVIKRQVGFSKEYPTMANGKGFWGNTIPEDADDYYYVIWLVQANMQTPLTQPWSMSITDVPGDANGENSFGGEVVGYSMVSSSLVDSTDYAKRTISASDLNRYYFDRPSGVLEVTPIDDTPRSATVYYNSTSVQRVPICVLVRYPKETFVDGTTVYNTVNVDVTGVDDGVVTSATATASFTYTELGFSAPPGQIKLEKKGSSSVPYAIGMIANDTAYELYARVTNGLTKEVWQNEIDVQAFTSTLREGGDPSNIEDYGQRPVHIELIDDMFFLNGDMSHELSSEDYEISQIHLINRLGIYARDVIPNMQGTGLTTVNVATADCPQLTVWVQIDGSHEWEELGVLHPENAENGGQRFIGSVAYPDVTLDVNSSGNATNALVNLPHNITGYKLSCDSTYYSTHLWTYCDITLKPSDRVKSLLQDENGEYLTTAKITDVNTARVIDADGNYLTGWGTTSSTARVMEHDNEWYGEQLYHQSKDVSLTGNYLSYSSTKGVTHSNDTSNGRVVLNYTLGASEFMEGIKPVFTPDDIVEMGLVTPQSSGIWYDLLPLGVEPDLSSIVVTLTDGERGSGGTYAWYDWYGLVNVAVDYDYDVVHNYNGTGRTLLIVRATVPEGVRNYSANTAARVGSGMKMTFTAYYPWEAMSDYGTTLTNIGVYESGNESMGGASTSDSLLTYSNGRYAPIVPALSDRDTSCFVPVSDVTSLAYVTASETELRKSVLTPSTESWTDGWDDNALVNDGEEYQYRLRFGVETNTKLRDMILFDSLENYTPEGGNDQFHGTFVGLDLSQPENLGVAPVVYYSTIPNLDLTVEANHDITNTAVWSTTAPANLADVKAIAIDLSTTRTGEKYILEKDGSMRVIVRMKAPTGTDFIDSFVNNEKAYNNVYLSDTQIAADFSETPFYIHHDYTKVGLATPLPIEVPVEKYDGETHELLEGAVLQIVDANGNVIEEWTSGIEAHTVILPRNGTYTLREKTPPEEYKAASPITFSIDWYGVVRVLSSTNTEGVVVTKLSMDDFQKPKTVEVPFEKHDGNTDGILSGCVLQVLDSEGNVLDEWTSGEEAHVVTLQREATYRLHEVSPPEGYATTIDIEFSIDADGNIIRNGQLLETVVIRDYPRVTLPSTGSMAAIILGVVGVVVVGAGLFIFLRKKDDDDDD